MPNNQSLSLPHATDLTAERPLLVVGKAMELELIFSDKGLAAHIAAPHPLSFVASHVVIPAPVENALACTKKDG